MGLYRDNGKENGNNYIMKGYIFGVFTVTTCQNNFSSSGPRCRSSHQKKWSLAIAGIAL